MSDEVMVVLALARSEWESDLVLEVGRELKGGKHRLFDSVNGSPAPARVRRAVDVVDLLSSTGAGSASVVALDPAFPRLTAEVVERLVARQVVILAVCQDEQAEGMARRLGIEWAVTVCPGELGRAAKAMLAVAARSLTGRGDMPGNVARIKDVGPVDSTGRESATTVPGGGAADGAGADGSSETTTSGKGRLVAVWGPAGAPGRTSVSLALSHLASLRGIPTMIIDGDLRAPGVAAALGLEPDTSGLAAAAALADRGALTKYSLARQARGLGERWRVLTGIVSADRWAEVTPTGVAAVMECARELDDLVMVDIGSNLLREDDILFDEVLPRRDAPAFYALSAADVVVAVGNSEPVGLARMLSALPQLREVTSAPVVPVVNRVRRSLGDFGSRRRLGELLARVDLFDPVWIPDDQPAFDRAIGRQLLPTEHDRTSEFARAVAGLVDRLGVSELGMAAGY